MNQKQKIIILFSSFLYGTPIIFLALRNNQHQKNNLVIKKEKKQKKEHSALFWIVLTIEIFIILAIITKYIYNLYQYLKTPEEKPDTNEEQKFVCGFRINNSNPDNKQIHIISCPKWDKKDADDFFEKLWTLEVINHQKGDYKNFYEFDSIKKEIKIFFNLMMNVFQMINFSILNKILKVKGYPPCDKLLSMAMNAQKNNDILASIKIIEGTVFYTNDESFNNAYQKQEYLTCFKIAMQDGYGIPYFNDNDDDIINECFFEYFYSFYDYVKKIQKELIKFLSLIADNKYRQLLEDLQKNKTNIDEFLKIKEEENRNNFSLN